MCQDWEVDRSAWHTCCHSLGDFVVAMAVSVSGDPVCYLSHETVGAPGLLWLGRSHLSAAVNADGGSGLLLMCPQRWGISASLASVEAGGGEPRLAKPHLRGESLCFPWWWGAVSLNLILRGTKCCTPKDFGPRVTTPLALPMLYL